MQLMKLIIYKGFDEKFLSNIQTEPLVNNEITKKRNVLLFDKNTIKKLAGSLLMMEDNEERWVTYEEYSLIRNRVDDQIRDFDMKVTIIKNNLYPDYYELPFEVSDDLAIEIDGVIEKAKTTNVSQDCSNYLAVYNSIYSAGGKYYGGFYNFEFENDKGYKVEEYYPRTMEIEDSNEQPDYTVFVNNDIDAYLQDLNEVIIRDCKIIEYKGVEGLVTTRIKNSLIAYCQQKSIRVINCTEGLNKKDEEEQELIRIAQEVVKIPNFKEFRKIRFYKNPDLDNETVEIPQSQIIKEIITQAENSYLEENEHSYRDIFITASTGAGKSVMFQIPAVYLAEKHSKLTIIIEPVKALMQDQKEQLLSRGYTRVEAFNSDLITQVEKEKALNRIKNGEVDLLYLSPETLLSYSIETIIGDREIGLLIVDEAHIVTTWGVGFRPDYWYLGAYINRLRNTIQTCKKQTTKVYHFPICAFTATAVNGGIDDSVGETVTSLYMENPIKYIGYVKRDDIGFDIQIKSDKKMQISLYEECKCNDLNSRLTKWIENNEKTIVYFPYASYAWDAFRGLKSFSGIKTSKKIGVYTGRNLDEISAEAFAQVKKDTFDKFRSGEISVMYATKAFGMGVDVNDVKNVYHYAASGNLSDYLQEVGRAARKQGLIGSAQLDSYHNDISFMQRLFGMSQIRQYQINKVLAGIYDVYKSKNGASNFLISPESFTYIFKGNDDKTNINRLKTSLLMLEKDLYDKFNFKVLISRPQSVFTKAYVVVKREDTEKVLKSNFGKCFMMIEKGRFQEKQADGSIISDVGDVYSIDLKTIWEEYYPNLSFPQFKYWYFNADSKSPDKVEIMPKLRQSLFPRQKVSIESHKELLLSELRENILADFDYIADTLYAKFKKSYFTLDEFAKEISERFGIVESRMIANSLFDLVDPNGTCVKWRTVESTNRSQYILSNGNFKEYLRKSIIKSRLMANLTRVNASTYYSYMNLAADSETYTNIALKLLSIFGYITYEVSGGEEPEIFIRLNDANKVRQIVNGTLKYSNNYVTKAKSKHDRDVAILKKFFFELNNDKDRWEYIEQYFLGYDVLSNSTPVEDSKVELSKSIDKGHSYQLNGYDKWVDMADIFFSSDEFGVLSDMDEREIPLPEYLGTIIKKSKMGERIRMSWPSKNVIIFQQDVDDRTFALCKHKGWSAYRIYEIDYAKLKKELM